jgi:hypothetical protein
VGVDPGASARRIGSPKLRTQAAIRAAALREEQKCPLAAKRRQVGTRALGSPGHGSREPFPVFKNLALPALRVQVAAARSA